MEVFERRRLNLAKLLAGMTAADLSRTSKVSQSYISRCLLEPGDDGYKSIGEVTARKLEKGARKPEGWLDRNEIESAASAQTAAPARPTPEQIMEALAEYLMQMDDDARDDAGDVLRKLALKPENHSRAAALFITAFQQGKRKRA